MNNSSDKVWGCFGMFIAFVVILVLSTVLGGWVMSILWAWFVVPTLGLPAISIVEAIGLTMAIRVLVNGYGSTSNKKYDDLSDLIANMVTVLFGMPLMLLGIGYIIHLFM